MNYQVGQAVIVYGDTLAIINHKHTQGMYGLKPLIGNNVFPDKHESEMRPATEDEILSEIQKQGWKDYSHLFVKSTVVMKDYFALQKTNTWLFEIQYNPEDTSDLKKYCEEGLIVDRIITALNLAK